MTPRPNRKNVAGLAQSLSQLDLTVAASPFVPLTQAKEAVGASSAEQQQQSKTVEANASVSYWEWPASVPQHSEEQVNVLSTDSITANLIRDAKAAEKRGDVVTEPSHDDYWAEQQPEQEHHKESDEQPSIPLHKQQPAQDYWHWSSEPVDKKQTLIDSILADEEARVATSAATIQRSMLYQSPRERAQVEATKPQNDAYWAWESPVVARHVVEGGACTDRYWDWSSQQTKTADETKNALIEAILAMESARQVLSTDRVVECLQSFSVSAQAVERQQLMESSDDYWKWSQDLGDAYWNWDASSQQQPVAVASGYWDW